MMLRRALVSYLASFSGLSRDVWMLSFVMLINRSGAMVVPFLSVYLIQELEYSKFQAGIAMSCFGIGSVIGSFGGGYLSDRFSYYRVQFWSLIGTAIGFLVLMQVETYALFCVSILLLSIVAESFRPANQVAILVYAHPEQLTRSLSLNRMAINLGFSIGPVLGGWLAYHFGFDWLFILDALTCGIAALVFRYFLVPKVEEAQDARAQGTPSPVPFAVLKDKTYLVFLFFVTLTGIAFMQFFYVVPVYLKEVFQMHEAAIGTLLALNGLLIVFIELPLIKRLEGRVKKLVWIQLGSVLIGASYVAYMFLGIWVLAPWVSIILVTFGEIFSLPFANAVAQQRSNPSNRGAYMAFYSASFSLAHIIAPSMGMHVAGRYGYQMVWLLLVIISVISLIGFRVLTRVMEPDEQVVQL